MWGLFLKGPQQPQAPAGPQQAFGAQDRAACSEGGDRDNKLPEHERPQAPNIKSHTRPPVCKVLLAAGEAKLSTALRTRPCPHGTRSHGILYFPAATTHAHTSNRWLLHSLYALYILVGLLWFTPVSPDHQPHTYSSPLIKLS